jgi:hypothetical protein
VNLESYCRDIEAYLCRKNDGHLIRIAGPAFERVSEWAQRGIPLKVACAGIDRYFERYYRKGVRRRPVRVEFCEADVLDAFDEWRRAVGVAISTTTDGVSEEQQTRPRQSLAAHLERAIARLTALRASSQRTNPFDATLDLVSRQLDARLPEARSLRGAARDALLQELAALDATLIDAALAAAGERLQAEAGEEARSELAPFRDRMTSQAYAQATEAAVRRYVRAYFGLPTLTFP